MKVLFKALLFVFVITTVSSEAREYKPPVKYQSRPNVFGGTTYYSRSGTIYSRRNSLSGQTYSSSRPSYKIYRSKGGK